MSNTGPELPPGLKRIGRALTVAILQWILLCLTAGRIIGVRIGSPLARFLSRSLLARLLGRGLAVLLRVLLSRTRSGFATLVRLAGLILARLILASLILIRVRHLLLAHV